MSSEKSGWLTKEGGSIKTWKRRWFTLKNYVLSYYKSQGDPEPKGKIEVSGSTVVRASNNKNKKPNCFEVTTPTRIFYICADTEEERDSWVQALNESIKSRDGSKGNNDQKLTV